MKERLAQLIEAHGTKHWSFAARKDEEFMLWVNSQTEDLPQNTSFAERVYSAVSGTRSKCENGGHRSLNNIVSGWRFCGRAKSCECARISVSVKCKEMHANIDQRARTNKIAATMQERYGVSNAGKLETTKAAHKAFYASEKASEIQNKIKTTMLSKYGVDNALKLPQANEGRKAIASNLSPEKKAASAIKRKKLASDGVYLSYGYNRVLERMEQTGVKMLTAEEDYKGTANLFYYDFECLECSLNFKDYIKDGHDPQCPACKPSKPNFTSIGEDEVAAIFEQLGLDVVRNTKKIINPFEIDIYLPHHKLAVEYCGLYWHSEWASGKKKNYHQDKLFACEEKGIRLITIFEDEWLLKPNIVRSRLLHAIGRSPREHARKTKVITLSIKEASNFLNIHHIQGDTKGATVALGLVKDSVLLSVMTFGPLRRFNNSVGLPSTYELYRFASSQHIMGAASKLFSAFVRQYSPTTVVSYCDRRWGQGNVYLKMGFSLQHVTAPGYWWLTDRYAKRNHRYNFNKGSLVKKGANAILSEVEIMRSLGHDRIWDCGNYKFVWTP
jgi:hypothetical protein